MQGWCELTPATSHGACSTLSIGEFPRGANASSLSQILQKREDVPQKYFLSPRACKGILRRAKERGKELPPELKAALEAQAKNETPSKDVKSPTVLKIRQPRDPKRGGAGAMWQQEQSYTVATHQDQTLFTQTVGLNDQGGGRMETYTDTAPTMRTQAHNHPPVVQDATVYVSGGFASFDEKPVAGSVRAAGGDRGGGSENLVTQ